MTFIEARGYCRALDADLISNKEPHIFGFIAPYFTQTHGKCKIISKKSKNPVKTCNSMANVICIRNNKTPRIEPLCPHGFVYNVRTSSCYFVTTNKTANWEMADKFCLNIVKDYGLESNLVSILNPKEHEFVLAMNQKAGCAASFLGALGNSKNGKSWSWVDGSYFPSYTRWSSTNPDRNRENSILMMETKTGDWYNFHPLEIPQQKACIICKISL
ncbi:unnamed protein product [Bursaphelenchus xylophilus]|uniref:(pine wood nematode) hypothetical protein n=1 Tax=Bursaphelenchus xylophilus TaxID=6326 RepID=A0A1I7S954_BURXY|nr:unnamed protein product [Bursaphelenchus xylophilus]CAG9086276.1 unnamed protein product [Bursaphelenchus xylophilus]